MSLEQGWMSKCELSVVDGAIVLQNINRVSKGRM